MYPKKKKNFDLTFKSTKSIVLVNFEMECEFSRGKKSTEEEVELQRSTKKAKESLEVPEFGSPPSYRDKLVGEMPRAFA